MAPTEMIPEYAAWAADCAANHPGLEPHLCGADPAAGCEESAFSFNGEPVYCCPGCRPIAPLECGPDYPYAEVACVGMPDPWDQLVCPSGPRDACLAWCSDGPGGVTQGCWGDAPAGHPTCEQPGVADPGYLGLVVWCCPG